MFNLEKHLAYARAFDAWRIVPRILVAVYGYLFYYVTIWFITLPDPTATQAAFVSTITGTSAAIFGLYVNSGQQK